MMQDVTGEPMAAEPDTAVQIREPGTGRFVAGAPSANPRGRPRKGQTLADRLAKEDEKVARSAIKARNKRLMREDQTGNRAWENYLAYRVGLPKQAYVIENVDSPLAALFGELAGLGALPQRSLIVEGESRTLPSDPSDG